MNTPKTDEILAGIKQLPEISLLTASLLVIKLRNAEIAMQKATCEFNDALRDIADQITNEDDGWTFDEVWKTNLRGSDVMMRHLRANGLDREPARQRTRQ